MTIFKLSFVVIAAGAITTTALLLASIWTSDIPIGLALLWSAFVAAGLTLLASAMLHEIHDHHTRARDFGCDRQAED